MSMRVISDVEMERILQEEPDEKVVMDAVRQYRAQHDREDKDRICQLLLPALKATRYCSSLKDLRYEKQDNSEEVVTAVWESNSVTKVNVSADSGIAMIRDILQALR